MLSLRERASEGPTEVKGVPGFKAEQKPRPPPPEKNQETKAPVLFVQNAERTKEKGVQGTFLPGPDSDKLTGCKRRSEIWMFDFKEEIAT